MDAIEAPLTLANVDVSLEPSLQGKLRKSIILTRGERRIGVIGVLNRFTPVIKFLSQMWLLIYVFGLFLGRKSPTREILNFWTKQKWSEMSRSG